MLLFDRVRKLVPGHGKHDLETLHYHDPKTGESYRIDVYRDPPRRWYYEVHGPDDSGRYAKIAASAAVGVDSREEALRDAKRLVRASVGRLHRGK